MVYDHAPERAWRYLDTYRFNTFIHAPIPRVKCHTHGAKQVKVGWVQEHSLFRVLNERLAIIVAKETSIKVAGRLPRISRDEAWQIMGRAMD